MAALLLITIAGIPSPALATEYPSWSDVEKARADEATKQAQISQLTTMISTLTAEVEAAKTVQARRSSEYEAAQGAFDEANYRAEQLQAQADETNQTSERSKRQAGRLASSLSRVGGVNLSATLLLNSDQADELLYRLGAMSKLAERSSIIYKKAENDKNAAASLTAQARVASSILAGLSAKAEATLNEAIAANNALQIKLDEQQDNAVTLAAQLEVLQEDRQATEADFNKGEEARRAAEAAAAEAAAAKAAEAAAAKAAAAAESAATQGGSGEAEADSGQLSSQGWTLPAHGWISDRYGPRPGKPVPGVSDFHSGTDIAAGCGQPVSAATSGTVVYAGWLGTYGNWVLIEHGDGVQTGYAHNSTILVEEGEHVSAGETIALVGTTGASSGCHSHFEVRVNGARIDPQPFMSARGVTLG
ncbi:M23 family metallopeptidase [Cryobacterium tepidiphilum]|uniref:Cell wall-binding protein n=1 Tax=Cryobacterium tepidiphilum TaxID=2486026 RepID=A0A3M8L1C6_9MICO|nr:M23 family metallopeptidase [Cryobacterium tepidiphilum]RNE59340.1 cell wall-binding protein [Cryobacterium tepidiphilum]